MARLILNDIGVETAEKFERRAKRLGTTPEEEASRLLRNLLRAEPGGEPASTGAGAEASDPRFVRQHGFLIFMGMVLTEEIPDHRALREERVDSLLKAPMKIAFDTSVLVAAMISTHRDHARAVVWLNAV